MSILRRPEDRASSSEEAAIEAAKARTTAALADVDSRLLRSSRRTVIYGEKHDEDSLRVERRVQDRILDERRAVMGLVGRHG